MLIRLVSSVRSNLEDRFERLKSYDSSVEEATVHISIVLAIFFRCVAGLTKSQS